jgi:methanogenic corrinoid protein MtbC1
MRLVRLWPRRKMRIAVGPQGSDGSGKINGADRSGASEAAASASAHLGGQPLTVPLGLVMAGEGEAIGPLGEPTLLGMIEGEIIPRLLLSHRGESAAFNEFEIDDDADAPIVVRQGGLGGSPVDRSRFAGIADAHQFAMLLIEQDVETVSRYVDVLRFNLGISDEAILLELFAPAARHLGVMWENDQCGFADVTVGTSALERLMVQLRPGVSPDAVPMAALRESELGATVLLAPCPGEQHGFGMLMVQDMFRNAGWDVCSGPFASAERLVNEVRWNGYQLVGLSLADAADDALARCRELISMIRAASRNRNVTVFVGGAAFLNHPERVGLVGADDTAKDSEEALAKAKSIFGTPQVARRLDS